MKHGVNMDPAVRDKRARIAVRLANSAESLREALRQIEDRFGVSNPTARNLVSRGRYLEANPSEAND
jgi:hypothetical protein